MNAYERYYIDIDDEVIEEKSKKVISPKTPLIGIYFLNDLSSSSGDEEFFFAKN